MTKKPKRVILTRDRARAVVDHIIPFLQVNIECDDGDLFVGIEDDEKVKRDIYKAKQWLAQEAMKRLTRTKRKTRRSGECPPGSGLR